MKLNYKNLAYNVVMAFLLASICFLAGFTSGAAIGVGAVTLSVGCLLPAQPATASVPGLAFMAIQKEIWIADAEEVIFPDNTFITKSINDSEGLQGRIVHVGQAGDAPNAEKNRQVLPAVAKKRADTVNDYVVDEYTTDPSVVTVTEQIESSFDKRVSVMKGHYGKLATLVADTMVGNWSPTKQDNIIYTSGASRAAIKLGQTGNRLKIDVSDFANAQRLLTRQDVPQDGRVCLLDADMLMDALLIPEFKNAYMFGQNTVLKDGVIARAFGFEFMTRSRTAMYTAAGVAKDPAAAASATDLGSVLFWHPDFVRRATGTSENGGIMIFEDNASPTYYGDVMSAMVRAGGKISRTDQVGVIALLEKTA
jgi:hypothetical protein